MSDRSFLNGADLSHEAINKINEWAGKEGWMIFYCEGSEDGLYQLQSIDDSKVFSDDIQAMIYVAEKTLCGSKKHKEALRTLLALNPKEESALLKSILLTHQAKYSD